MYGYDYVYLYAMIQNGYAYWFLVDILYEFAINIMRDVLIFWIIILHYNVYAELEI